MDKCVIYFELEQRLNIWSAHYDVAISVRLSTVLEKGFNLLQASTLFVSA